jgi:CspA family cold shock protein
MATGVIKDIKDKGYGFIVPGDGGRDLFFHVRNVVRGVRPESLAVGMAVGYEVKPGERGPMAVQVAPLAEVPAPETPVGIEPTVEECVEGLRQVFLAGLEWMDLFEAALKRR